MAKLEWDGSVLRTEHGIYSFEFTPKGIFQRIVERICVSYSLCCSYVRCTELHCSDEEVSFRFAGNSEESEGWNMIQVPIEGIVSYNKNGLNVHHFNKNYRDTHNEPLKGPWDHYLF